MARSGVTELWRIAARPAPSGYQQNVQTNRDVIDKWFRIGIDITMPKKERPTTSKLTPDEALATAESRVAAAIATPSDTLNLSGLDLERLPESLRELTSLRQLAVEDNQLTTLPEWIATLAKLEKLSCFNNQVTSMPESIGELQQLETLYAGGNLLDGLPESLGQLAKLKTLSLWGNKFSSLPNCVSKLRHLQKLSLPRNHLALLPEWIGEIEDIDTLNISENQLTTLPESLGRLDHLHTLILSSNRLTELPDSLRQMRSLRVLFLHDNPGLRLPTSVLGPTYNLWIPDQAKVPKPNLILDFYFRTRLLQERRPLREAKLILVGRGEVGKTSLVKRLVENKFSRREDRTQGIRITKWPLTVKGAEEVRMHVWDFGGQEIMHATHQFFLTDRSVYMLVLDGRGGQQETEADYWLRIITSFAPESPVIVVLNKVRKDPFDLNRRALQDKYPQIKAFVETDCDNSEATTQPGAKGLGIDELRKAVARETNRLPDLRAAFPAAWFEIKEKLSKTRKNFLAFDEYRAICAKYGEQDEGAQ